MLLKKINNIIKDFKISLTEQELLELLQIRKRWPHKYLWGQNTVEIISNQQTCESIFFFKADGYLDYEKWFDFYNLGYTTIISNALDINKELRHLNKILTNVTGLSICGNLYFSKPGQTPSFYKHKHDYDVIVKQIYGETEWFLNDKKFILKPNYTCIIEKNMYHQVLNKQDKKLSLTLNIT